MKSHSSWAIAALFAMTSSVSTLVHAAAVSGQGTWETTLQGRDLDGNITTAEAYYDTVLGITWLANANAGAGSSYDNGISNDGRMTWINAYTWASSFNPYNSGITGWRLPKVTDTDGPDADFLGNDGCNSDTVSAGFFSGSDCGYNVDTSTGEMAHLFYVTLGDKAYYNTIAIGPQEGWGLTNTGPFLNLQDYVYWTNTGYAPNILSEAWTFYFGIGSQFRSSKGGDYNYAWAVHDGDVGAAVSTVPVPAAMLLFGSGLAGLLGFARRKARFV